MKFFRKKNARSAEISSKSAEPHADHGLYSRYTADVSPDEYAPGAVGHQTQRTSRHSPVHRRKPDNRASNWAMAILLLRTGLIVVLLVGGFFVLKLVLNRMAEPSEKEQKRWENKAAQTGKGGATVAVSTGAPNAQALGVSPELIGQRLGQWEEAERHLRSAEALSRRGIDEEAIQRLGLALQVMPDNRAAQEMLVGIYMRRGLYAESVPLCLRLLDQEGWQQELQMNLLSSLQKSGQTASAVVLADRMLQEQPNNLTVLSIAATGQMGLGNTNSALMLFERMLENDAKNIVALRSCGAIHFARGDYSNSIPYYVELVRLDPKPDYYQALARCYAQQSQAGKAVVFMGQAASLFGGTEVSPWLKDAVYNPIRESAEFRSFADRLVGVETRKAIEAINKRDAEKAAPQMPAGLDLPKQPALQLRK
jgi:tetratricopeptide (TPR) repeat protein